MANTSDCANKCRACSGCFDPIALAISAVVPWLRPLPADSRMKNTGKDSDSAASASVPRMPAQYVSAKLNIVLKKKPTLAGSAMRRVSTGMGSVRREDMKE